MPHERDLYAYRVPGLRNGRGFALRVLLVCALLLAPATGAEAASATISAVEEDGYGRLVLTFADDIPDAQVQMAGGVAVISFSEAVSLPVERIQAGLPSFVNVVRQDPDGRGVRLALSQPARINTTPAAERLFIDFLPSNWTGMAPGLPQEVIEELAARAREAERLTREAAERKQPGKANIEVEFVSMPTFGRYVFTPDKPIPMSVERDAAGVDVIFQAPSTVGLGTLQVRLPEYVSDITRTATSEQSVVRFSVLPTLTVRDFREGDSYVVDLVPSEGYVDERTSSAPTDAEPAQAEAPVAEAPVEEEPSTAEGAAKAEAAEAEAPARTVAEAQGEARAANPEAATAEPEPAAPQAKDAAPRREETTPAAEEAAETEAPAQDQTKPDRPVADTLPGAPLITAEPLGDGLRVTFEFPKPTPTAVFERMQHLWIVLETQEPIDPSPLREVSPELFRGIENWQSGGATVLRLALSRPLLTTVDAAERMLSVVIGGNNADVATPLSLRRVEDDGLAVAEILMSGAGKLHEFPDPQTGGDVLVVTALGPARPILKTQRFVDFTLWPTAHAVALERVADGLSVGVQDSLVRISRPRGLNLSAATGESLSMLSSQNEQATARPAYVEIDPGLTPGEARDRINEQMRQLAAAPEVSRNAERIALARTYVSLRLGVEALGLLDIALESDRELQDDARARALRGMALVQMHRPEQALEQFSGFGLSQSTDAALWRGLAHAQLGQWAKALESFGAGRPAISSYSKDFQHDVLLAQAQAALELGQLPAAAGALDQAEDAGAGGDRRFQFLDGWLAEQGGDRNRAMAAYELVTKDPFVQDAIAAKARLRKILLGHAMEEITDDETIAQLESLTFGWRGDDTEFTASAKLANLYADKGEYRRAFELMRTALMAGPDSAATAALQADMEAVFEKLFLSTSGGDLPTVDALALYYDFKEMTPIGRKGDEMIRALAERLISLDLLDQAGELLAYQIEHRLEGAARAQVATRLAAVHLLAKRPAAALKVLTDTRVAHLPPEIENERTLLEAKALGESGRTDLALDLLGALPVDGRVRRIRSDILWRDERWQEAGEELERVLDGAWGSSGPLSDNVRTDVLRTGIAYAMSGDFLGAQRLRTKFLDKMAGTADARAFDVVTEPAAAKEGELDDVVRRLGETDTLRAFMKEYSARISPEAVPKT